jgi:hypothetical protein
LRCRQQRHPQIARLAAPALRLQLQTPSVLLERIEQQLHNGKKGVTKWWKVGKSGKK